MTLGSLFTNFVSQIFVCLRSSSYLCAPKFKWGIFTHVAENQNQITVL